MWHGCIGSAKDTHHYLEGSLSMDASDPTIIMLVAFIVSVVSTVVNSFVYIVISTQARDLIAWPYALSAVMYFTLSCLSGVYLVSVGL